MGKAEITRQSVLETGMGLASTVGLHGISFGVLAQEMKLSKSGLFNLFGNKELLQMQLLEHAAARFVELVVKPALAAPRGEPRLRALYTRWLAWPEAAGLPGGCLFVQSMFELDDQPGHARDAMVAHEQEWLATLATVVRGGVRDGAFRKDVDGEQAAIELMGIMLAYQLSARLLRDRKARARADLAFESLVARLKA